MARQGSRGGGDICPPVADGGIERLHPERITEDLYRAGIGVMTDPGELAVQILDDGLRERAVGVDGADGGQPRLAGHCDGRGCPDVDGREVRPVGDSLSALGAHASNVTERVDERVQFGFGQRHGSSVRDHAHQTGHRSL